MTRIFSKKPLIAFISCCIITIAVAFACADSWDEEYGNSSFTPEVFVDSTYSPFFLSSQYYYSVGHDDEYNSRFNYDNTLQWSAYLKKGFIHEELAYVLQKASLEEIDSATAFISGKISTAPVAMQAFVLLKEKKDKKASAFLNYLHYAKISELFAVNDIPEWYGDSTKKKNNFDATALDRQLLSEFSKTNELFLKERYCFQLIRSYFFNGAPQKAIDFFNNTEKQMPHSQMYYRALCYVAGAYYKLKKFSIANYYYSKVYDSCNELKMPAHFSFHPQEESDWKATLALCADNNERATLWQMLGVFYSDEKRAIKEIYAIDPKNEKLYLLLARSINKYEQDFNKTSGEDYAEVPHDTAVDSKTALHNLVEQIANTGNTAKPWIWDLAAGYINTIDKHYALAASYYDKAKKILPKEKAAQAQLKLLMLMNNVAKAKIIDKKTEDDLHEDIEWLRMLDDKNTMPIPQFRYQNALVWLRKTFAKRYKAQKELVKSECFINESAFFADNKNTEALKTFLAKPNKTPYETMCDELSVIRLDDIYEFQATKAAYADSIDDAIQKMQNAQNAGRRELLGNPFNARITDCHDCDFAAPQKIKYTKMSFLKKLKELETTVAAGKDVYNNALLLANAFYNMSHFGNARVFYECKIVGNDHSDPMYIEPVFRKRLINMDIALKYYRLAYQNALGDEQKAKCQFLIAKCERNEWYNKNVYNKKEMDYGAEPLADFNSFNGFAELKKYPNTQYYKEVIKECGYFRTYMGIKK